MGVLVIGACTGPRPTVRAPTPTRVESPVRRGVRRPCAEIPRPALGDGWRLVGWPAVPRFTSVDTQGVILHATTTAAVCASTDGGRNWHTLIDGLDSPELVFVDVPRIVVRTEESDDPSSERVDRFVWWVSQDNGAVWTRHTELPVFESTGHTRVQINSSDARGEFSALACGHNLFAVVPGQRRKPAALRSQDAGATWTRLRIPPRLREPGMHFRCAGSGVIALEHGGAVPLVSAFSRDEGTSWQVLQRLPFDAALAALDDDVEGRSRGCVPMNGNEAFCEHNGEGWGTTDAGRRWFRTRSPVGGRTMLMYQDSLVGVGGGVALSTDTGRHWQMVTLASGRANLGVRGGVVSDRSFWLAGTALWWTDDGGERWIASLLPWELVAVVDRQHWVGFRPPGEGRACGGDVQVSTDAGRTWRSTLRGRVERVLTLDGTLYATLCGGGAMMVSTDGLRWRAAEILSVSDPDDDPERAIVTREGVRVSVREGTVTATRPDGVAEVIARAWPSDLHPVAAWSPAGTLRVLVCGNGTVLRRD